MHQKAKTGSPSIQSGINHAKQVRSQATYRKLIKAGKEIFTDRLMNEASVQQIANKAGVSVGGFYARFANKESFFQEVQESAAREMLLDMERLLTTSQMIDMDAASYIRALAKLWVRMFRRNRFLYIASVRNVNLQEDRWGPIRRLGIAGSAILKETTDPHLAKIGIKRSSKDYRILSQVVSALLFNAVLNDPGPIKLKSKEMVNLVAQLIANQLGVTLSTDG